MADGLAFTRERGFWSHAYNLEVHRCLLLLRRGDWDGAERGCAGSSTRVDDPGMLFAYSVPVARAPARAPRRPGRPSGMLAAAWEQAQRQRLLLGLAYAGIARVEWAWLAGEPDDRRARSRRVLLPRTEHPGAAPFRGELLRYLARAGLPAEPFEGCPPAWAAGLEGDWRAAAAAWQAAGDPYEAALELAESGEAERDRRGAARSLEGLGAEPRRGRARASACARWARASRAGRGR